MTDCTSLDVFCDPIFYSWPPVVFLNFPKGGDVLQNVVIFLKVCMPSSHMAVQVPRRFPVLEVGMVIVLWAVLDTQDSVCRA